MEVIQNGTKDFKTGFFIGKLHDVSQADLQNEFCFFAKTDQENSLVCPTEFMPDDMIEREDGWRAFRIQGILDFSLIGILAEISSMLADHKIGIFVISTYNTDYILTKAENFERAVRVLADHGYEITH